MTTWTNEELDKIGNAEELEIMSLRADGRLRKPVPIWVVRVGDNLYIRAYKGRGGPWFRATQECHAGCIRSGGVEKDVHFVDEIDPALNDQIDEVYRAKYHEDGPEFVDPMVAPDARSATLKLAPR